jgi:pilus assembly protein CpaF
MSTDSFGRRVITGGGNNRLKPVVGFGRGNGAAPAFGNGQTGQNQARPRKPVSNGAAVDQAFDTVGLVLRERLTPDEVQQMPRGDAAMLIEEIIVETLASSNIEINELERRDLITALLNDLLSASPSKSAPETSEPDGLVNSRLAAKGRSGEANRASIEAAKTKIQPLLMDHLDATAANKMTRAELAEQVGEIVGELMVQEKLNLNLREQRDLVTMLLNDMLGLGPLEPLLEDESITDILVNGPKSVFVERKGLLELTDVHFRDNAHLMNICTRIVSAIGRRVDESSPLCDARLADGSRVNIIIPPLAIDGPSISIRKFAKQKITLEKMAEKGNVSQQMLTVLKIASACRLNILISGGTGSGKTTMLNALSRMIDPAERIVTIEDAAELQMQQPHVVRLETRPANLEGNGEISMRDLVKNSLRMRPDRIILGEVRGAEAIDVLQAMNTGHDGSMCTLHANRPREALTRMENMVGMGGINLPSKAVRTQIAAAVDLIVQVARMRDGVRRVQAITEVVGMEGDVITTQDLFVFKFEGEDSEGKLIGKFHSMGVRPHFTPKAEYYGLHRALLDAI